MEPNAPAQQPAAAPALNAGQPVPDATPQAPAPAEGQLGLEDVGEPQVGELPARDPAGQQPVDPWGFELPPEAQQFFGGAQTLAQVRERYRGSSGEGQRLREENEALQVIIDAAQRELAATRSAPQQPAVPAQMDPWFGFGSQEAYSAAWQSNPAATEQRKLNYLRQFDAKPAETPERGSAVSAALNDLWVRRAEHQDQQYLREVQAANPEFVPGKPLFTEAQEYARRNPWIMAAANAFPQQNFYEVLVRLVRYDQLQRTSAGQASRLDALRANSRVAQTSVAGQPVPAGGTPKNMRDAVERAAALRAAAGHPVDPALVDAARRGAMRS